MIDAETGDPVDRDETVMGYEFEKNRYVAVEREELDSVKTESSETIEIEHAVPTSDVDWLYWDTPYLVEPDGKTGADIFATIRDAVRSKKVAVVGRMVLALREHPVLLMACGRGMLLITMRDPDEVRTPKQVFDSIPEAKVQSRNLQMAEKLIENMKGDFDLSMFKDRYQEKLRELIEAKLKGRKPKASHEPHRPSNVVNLFDALKKSLDKGGTAESRTSSKSRTARKSGTGGRTGGKKRQKSKERKAG